MSTFIRIASLSLCIAPTKIVKVVANLDIPAPSDHGTADADTPLHVVLREL